MGQTHGTLSHQHIRHVSLCSKKAVGVRELTECKMFLVRELFFKEYCFCLNNEEPTPWNFHLPFAMDSCLRVNAGMKYIGSQVRPEKLGLMGIFHSL